MEKTRFYKYYFQGITKPVIMEAESKAMADDMLQQLSGKSNTNIDMRKLEDFRLETPIIGISKRKRHGEDFIWVGKENSSDGWLLASEFERIDNLKQRK